MTDVCNNFANFGMSCFSKQRLLFMIATTVLCVFSVISALIAWFGNSDDDDTVKNCAWTIFADDVSGVTLDWYFGTFKYVHESDTLQGDNLSYEQCIEFDPFFDDDYYYTTFCRDCKDAGITANNCTVVTLIILAFLVGLSMARMLLQDRWLYKIAFVAMSLVNILVITIGLGSWDDQCVQEHIEDDLSSVGGKLLDCIISVKSFHIIFISLCL